MSEKPNIEELLNGYIDGELSERQQVEVQRLVLHDVHVAKRLRQLEECKMLVGSLPQAEAPPDILQRVKASLERKALASQWSMPYEQRRGARHLLFRKVLAVAAMIGLVAVLGAVIYTIVVPEGGTPAPTVALRPSTHEPSLAMIPASRTPAPPFYGRLELKTPNLLVVDATLNCAIEDNALSDVVNQTDRNLYEFSCSNEALGSLLTDLEYVWQKFDAATLILETNRFGEQVVVDNVKPEQITEVVNQKNLIERIRLAKEFAVSNSVENLLPGKEILLAIQGQKTDWAIPKPRLAGGTKAARKAAAKVDGQRNVHLTITLKSSR